MNNYLSNKASWRFVLVAASLAFGLGMASIASATQAATGVSDEQVTTHVKAGLANVANLKGADIDVKTVDGVVTLSGTVSDWHAKFAAVAAADSVAGVRVLNDELKTEPQHGMSADPRSAKPGARRAVPDARITADVQELLAHNVAKPYAVAAKTDHGVVFLSGNVMDGSVVERIRSKVAKVDGVKSVNTLALEYPFVAVAY